MVELSWGQWFKLAFGVAEIMKKHPNAVPVLRPLINDALDLWESVVPPSAEPAGAPMSPTEVIEKIRAGDVTPAEKAVMDRASQSWG